MTSRIVLSAPALALAALGATTARAFELPTTATYPTADFLYEAARGDFDGDADLDAVFVSYDTGEVFLFRNDGIGRFDVSVAFTTDTRYAPVEAGDFDGDGHLDLCLVHIAPPWVTIAYGDGTGAFDDQRVFTTTHPSPAALAVGDFDGDGIDDIATGHQDAGTVEVRRGDALRGLTLSDTHVVTTEGIVRAMVTGDVTGDGILDLLVPAELASYTRIYEGLGDGTFVVWADDGNGGADLVLLDIDSDGDLDLIEARRTTRRIDLYRNLGYTFATPQGAGLGFDAKYELMTGDFDCNGETDLATNIYDGGSSRLVVALNEGADLTEAWSLPLPVDVVAYGEADDFDGDGCSDLLVAVPTTTDVRFFGTRSYLTSTTSVSVSPSSAARGATRTASISVTTSASDVSASGSVALTLDGLPYGSVALVDGEASLVVDGGAIGTHTLVARYAGADTIAPSHGAVSFETTARAATVEVFVTPSEQPFGAGVTIGARVTGPGPEVPSGTLTYVIGGVAQAPVALVGGEHVFPSPFFASGIGARSVSASYSGDADFAAASGQATWTTTKQTATLSVAVAPASAVIGVTRTATATLVTNVPLDVVGFATLDDEPLAPVVFRQGVATFTLPATAAGTHTLALAFGGNLVTEPADATTTFETLRRASAVEVVVTPDAHDFGTPMEVSVRVTGDGPEVPSGAVTLLIDGAAYAGTLVDGAFVVPGSIVATQVGSGTVSVSYDGDAVFAPSSGAATWTTRPAPSTLSVSVAPASAVVGAPRVASVTLHAHAPLTASVAAALDGVALAPVQVVDGQATLTLPATTVGAHVLALSFAGDAFAAPASAEAGFETTARPAQVEVVVTPADHTFGTPLTIGARVTGDGPEVPSGTVTFIIEGEAYVGALVDGAHVVATPIVATQVGPGAVSVSYGGDAVFAPASGSATWLTRRAPTTLSVSVAPAAAVIGAPRSALVTLSGPGPLTASVAVTLDGAPLGPLLVVAGQASFPLPATAAGTHTLALSFDGSAEAEPASAQATFETLRRPSHIVASSGALGLQPSAVLTDRASGAPLVGRTVRFTSGSATLCSATTAANGRAQCQVSAGSLLSILLGGGGSSTASFAGDATHEPVSDSASLFE